jgi:hypothetical protein
LLISLPMISQWWSIINMLPGYREIL